MGIKNLFKFIREKYPKVLKHVSIAKYENKKIAVDVSTFIYKYKIVNGDNWITSILSLLYNFKKYNIHANFIFDNEINRPIEKSETREKRHEQKDKFRNKLSEMKKDLEEYYNTNKISELLQEVYDKYGDNKLKSFLLDENKEDVKTIFDAKVIEDRINKMDKQDIVITKYDIEKLQHLFSDLGIPYYTAELEGEKLAAELCIAKEVDAVYSYDSDCLCYGVPIHIIDMEKDTFTIIYLEKLLKKLELKKEEFVDFCIMCGCDYNTNIPKVGIVNSLKLIKQNKKIENITIYSEEDKEKYLKYKKCRELFTPNKTDIKAQYWKTKQEQEVKGIIEDYTTDNRIIMSFPKCYEIEIEIEDDDMKNEEETKE